MKADTLWLIRPRSGMESRYFIILPDNGLKKLRRFTIYQLPPTPILAPQIVGEKLTLRKARQVVRRLGK